MSNVLLAKNSFLNGLIMDFSPDNTQATCMTSALNATLLTFNGNELTLQNDMGNGRVETARLPEGYIPVGTCEFGDIIYIVSYNPILNKSQIGCFPSPERNISSDENINSSQQLTTTDFQKVDNNTPTGELVKTSVKKVLLETKKLNPGDKYIIYTDNLNDLTDNSDCLSDWRQGEHEKLPKNVKLHVVSIEDSGKITYLDSTTKWYNIDSTNNTDYYINCKKLKEDGTSDIDTFRNLLESNWSIFSSKVSGKLAILAELETIDTFSCSYELKYEDDSNPDPDANGIIYKKYSLTLYPSYTSSHERIIPAYICATESTFSNVDDPYNLTYTFVNGTTKDTKIETGVFEGQVEGNIAFTKSNSDGWRWPTEPETPTQSIETGIIFKIPYKLFVNEQYIPIKSDSFVYNLDLVPCMSFGRLDHLKQTITIDFNKVGTGEIELTDWKYHNSDITSILTYGINSYLKPLHEIKGIIIDFYDNKGLAAEYVLEGKKSYNGIFTEYIQFGSKLLNYKVRNEKIDLSTLRNLDLSPTTRQDSTSPEWECTKLSDLDIKVIKHAGEKLEAAPSDYNSNEDLYVKEEPQPQGDGQGDGGQTTYYKNDSGIIYPNWLYAVKIYVISGRIDNNLQWEYRSFERWYWTTSMFNEHYYDTSDFDILPFKLTLNSQTTFESKSNFIWQESSTNNLITNEFNPENIEETYSANKASIGIDGESNINMYVHAGLLNDYGCFNLLYKASDNPLSNIQMDIYIDSGNINYDNFEYGFSNELVKITEENFIKKKPITISVTESFSVDDNLTDNKDGLSDLFSVTISGETSNIVTEDNDTNLLHYNITLDEYYDGTETETGTGTIPIQLIYKSVLYNKAYVLNIYSTSLSVPVYAPIINSLEDLNKLGIYTSVENIDSKKTCCLYFKNGYTMGTYDKTFCMAPIEFTGENFGNSTDSEWIACASTAQRNDDINVQKLTENTNVPENDKCISLWESLGANDGNTFFLCYPGGGVGENKRSENVNVTIGFSDSQHSTENWRKRYWKESNSNDPGTIIKNKELFIYNPDDDDPNSTKSTTIKELQEYNTSAFLGINTGDCFTLLNTVGKTEAKISNDLEYLTLKFVYYNKFAEKPAYWPLGFKHNFAQLLFLLLSNTYHQKKTLDYTEPIEQNNVVFNKEFTATLTKDIIVKLSELSTQTKNDIAFYGKSFNGYISTIKSLKIDSNTNVFSSITGGNITLQYEPSAVSNTLTVSKKVKPLILDEMNIKCGVLKCGKPVWLSEDLNSETFYLYKSNKLSKYKDGTLKFDVSEINNIIKYLFKQFSTIPERLLMNSNRLSDNVTQARKEYITAFNAKFTELKNKIIQGEQDYYDTITINGNNYSLQDGYFVLFENSLHPEHPEYLSNKNAEELTKLLTDIINHCHNEITGINNKDSLKKWLINNVVTNDLNNLDSLPIRFKTVLLQFGYFSNCLTCSVKIIEQGNSPKLIVEEGDNDNPKDGGSGGSGGILTEPKPNPDASESFITVKFSDSLPDNVVLNYRDIYGFDCGLGLNSLFKYDRDRLQYNKSTSLISSHFSLLGTEGKNKKYLKRGGFLTDYYLDKDFRFNLEANYDFNHYE